MANSAGLIDWLLEALAPLGGISARRMFGGHGLFRDGLMFALVVADTPYLKAAPEDVPAFEAVGCAPFTYHRAGRPVALGYWQLPAAALDEPEELRRWAGRALAASRRGNR